MIAATLQFSLICFSSREANQDAASTLQAEVAESDFTMLGHLFDDIQWPPSQKGKHVVSNPNHVVSEPCFHSRAVPTSKASGSFG